jgi:hypothetical protein
MITNTWVMTTGVRHQGLARSSATAKAARPAAVPKAITVSAIPLVGWYDFPSAVATAANTAATARPTASAACAAAARRSDTGRAPAARVAISSHLSVQDPGAAQVLSLGGG